MRQFSDVIELDGFRAEVKIQFRESEHENPDKAEQLAKKALQSCTSGFRDAMSRKATSALLRTNGAG
jgi:hypothetical protein